MLIIVDINYRLAQRHETMRPTIVHLCHCEEAVRLTWQSPDTMLIFAVQCDRLLPEIATSLRSSQ